MLKDSVKHSLFLLISLFLALIWVNSKQLSNYSLQLTAFLVIFLVFAHKLFKTSSFLLSESVISTLCVTLITSATGGLSSPFFFLNHFLLFELSLLLEPVISIMLTLGLMSFYLFTNQTGSAPSNLIILFSFIFMTPLAYLVGKIYQKLTKQNNEIEGLTGEIEVLEKQLLSG